VTPEAARLLDHWRHHQFGDIRLFFCKIGAVETAIRVAEVASDRAAAGAKIWTHIRGANKESNPDLLRASRWTGRREPWLLEILELGAGMPTARLAQPSDLEGLLDLFRMSEVSAIAEPAERAKRIWSETLGRDGLVLFVSESGARIAAT
jgi:hypothetical protein